MNNIVYGLLDPINNTLHYIGYTSEPQKRLIAHCQGTDGTKEKLTWIRHLKKIGQKPIMVILREYTTADELPEAEKIWYNFYKAAGFILYNDPYFIGGGSRKGRPTSEEAKKKLSLAHKGKRPSLETKAKMSTSQRKRKVSIETRIKMSFAKQNISEETKEKMSSAMKNNTNGKGNKGRKYSDETRIKMSLAAKGRKMSEETKMKISLALKIK